MVKHFMSKRFNKKDLGWDDYVLGIKIWRDRAEGMLGFSQRTYINKVLKRFGVLVRLVKLLSLRASSFPRINALRLVCKERSWYGGLYF